MWYHNFYISPSAFNVSMDKSIQVRRNATCGSMKDKLLNTKFVKKLGTHGGGLVAYFLGKTYIVMQAILCA